MEVEDPIYEKYSEESRKQSAIFVDNILDITTGVVIKEYLASEPNSPISDILRIGLAQVHDIEEELRYYSEMVDISAKLDKMQEIWSAAEATGTVDPSREQLKKEMEEKMDKAIKQGNHAFSKVYVHVVSAEDRGVIANYVKTHAESPISNILTKQFKQSESLEIMKQCSAITHERWLLIKARRTIKNLIGFKERAKELPNRYVGD